MSQETKSPSLEASMHSLEKHRQLDREEHQRALRAIRDESFWSGAKFGACFASLILLLIAATVVGLTYFEVFKEA